MVAGIVLLALGLKKTLGARRGAAEAVPAVALLGGAALYLLAHVAFRWRNVHRFSTPAAGRARSLLVALIPRRRSRSRRWRRSAILAALLVALIVYETLRFAELRDRMRHQLADDAGATADPGTAGPGH